MGRNHNKTVLALRRKLHITGETVDLQWDKNHCTDPSTETKLREIWGDQIASFYLELRDVSPELFRGVAPLGNIYCTEAIKMAVEMTIIEMAEQIRGESRGERFPFTPELWGFKSLKLDDGRPEPAPFMPAPAPAVV